MSRYNDDWDETFPGATDLWQSNVNKAIKGRKGQKALKELREALLALPTPELIEGSLHSDEGVCAVGAYAWHKKVLQGMDPVVAFESIPLDDSDGDEYDIYETAEYGKSFGLTYTLAWELAYRNDEYYDRQTPAQRYDSFMNWLNKVITLEVSTV